MTNRNNKLTWEIRLERQIPKLRRNVWLLKDTDNKMDDITESKLIALLHYIAAEKLSRCLKKEIPEWMSKIQEYVEKKVTEASNNKPISISLNITVNNCKVYQFTTQNQLMYKNDLRLWRKGELKTLSKIIMIYDHDNGMEVVLKNARNYKWNFRHPNAPSHLSVAFPVLC